MIIQHLANSKKRWNQDLKIENAEMRHPNREAIAAYKESLGAKSGKSKEDDTEEEPEELEDDEEELEFDVVDIEDDKDKDDEDLDEEVDEEGAEASGNEIDTNYGDDEVPEKNLEPVNKSLSFVPIFLPPRYLMILYTGLELHKVEPICQRQGFGIKIAKSTNTSPGENSEEDPYCTVSIDFCHSHVLIYFFSKREEGVEGPNEESLESSDSKQTKLSCFFIHREFH